jgi:hypothetical protein
MTIVIPNLNPERLCTRMSDSDSGTVQRSSRLSLCFCQFRAAPNRAESISHWHCGAGVCWISPSASPLRSSFLNSGCSSGGAGRRERTHACIWYHIIHWVVDCKVIIRRCCSVVQAAPGICASDYMYCSWISVHQHPFFPHHLNSVVLRAAVYTRVGVHVCAMHAVRLLRWVCCVVRAVLSLRAVLGVFCLAG